MKAGRILSALSWSAVCLAAAILIALAGCANKRVTWENYERIREGMPMEEVERILGKPSRRRGEDYYYKGEYGSIKIEVEKGRGASYQRRVDDKEWKEKR